MEQEIWDGILYCINNSRSQYFEDYALDTINNSNYSLDDLILKMEYHDKKAKYFKKLANERKEDINKKTKKMKELNKAVEVIIRIENNHGKVGKNQIRNISKNYGVNYEDLLFMCRKKEINIVKFLNV